MPRTIECFYPGRNFPAISVTGASCELGCKHCGGMYLQGMVHIKSPDELLEFSRSLESSGGKGFLLSGGSDARGKVPLKDYVTAVARIKSETSLMVNAHIGLTPHEELEELVNSGIDSFSIDVYGSDETISEVLGMKATADDYLKVVRSLMSLNAGRVVPHLCIGIHKGTIRRERDAITALAPLKVPVLVLISFMPTRGTVYEDMLPPPPSEVIDIIRFARETMPETQLILGCMRSRKNRSWEVDAVKAGLDGIVLPSESTLSLLSSSGYTVKRRDTCCSLIGHL